MTFPGQPRRDGQGVALPPCLTPVAMDNLVGVDSGGRCSYASRSERGRLEMVRVSPLLQFRDQSNLERFYGGVL